MTDALFQLNDARKSLGTFTLEIGRLDVHQGEVLGTAGPTGAGKTTLLQMLAGLIDPDRGHVLFESQSFQSHRRDLATRRRLTLVHQRPLLLTGTVRYNVAYGLRLRKQHGQSAKVDAMLERLGLSAFAQHSAQTLSGGQAQLVALARALVVDPDVLLLDEPTSHLDPAHVALVEETVDQVRQERTMTVVWATHNLFQARRVAKRTALLLNGNLVEVGETENVFTNPADPRTDDFVNGRMVY